MRSGGLKEALQRKSFRYLFFGITLSRIGDTMSFIVITWLALGIGGPRAVGLVAFMGGCIAPAAAPVIGHLLDRLGTRILMLVDNLGRGLLMLGLAAVAHQGHVHLVYLLAFAGGSAVLSPATEVGQNVAVPALVNSRELDAANTLLATSWDVAAWLGPAVAGLALGALGSSAVLLMDAATFFAMAVVSLGMPRGLSHEEGEADSAASGLLTGFRILWRVRPVAIMTAIGVADLFLGAMVEVLLPAFNKLTLHQGPTEYGLLVSIAGAACLLGTLVLTPLVSRLGYGPALVIVLLARAVAVIPLGLAGSWALAAVFLALAAVPDGSFFPISRTIQQRLIPAGVRGRVQGAKGALGAAGWPLGSAIGGILVAAIGARPTVLLIGIGYLPLAAAIAFTPQIMHYAVPAAGPVPEIGPVLEREQAAAVSEPPD